MTPACPRCGTVLVYRERKRFAWVHHTDGRREYIDVYYWQCRNGRCGHRWDGVNHKDDARMPTGVEART